MKPNRLLGVSLGVVALSSAGLFLVDTAAQASGTKLTQSQAEHKLRGTGIHRLSSGNCTDRSNSHCTSYEQINSGTIDGVITLRRASHCPITITAGTEAGHARGAKSHGTGYKVDISRNGCIDNYVRKSFRSKPPSFGSEQYVSGAGNVYTNEGNHWDVLYQ